MSCSPPVRTIRTEAQTVFSRGAGGVAGASDPWVLSPDEIVEIAPALAQARVSISVAHATGATGDCLTQVVLQSTEDGLVWSAPVNMEPSAVGGNRTATTDWYSNAANFKRGIRFGVVVSQGNGVTTVQSCSVVFVIDLQLKS